MFKRQEGQQPYVGKAPVRMTPKPGIQGSLSSQLLQKPTPEGCQFAATLGSIAKTCPVPDHRESSCPQNIKPKWLGFLAIGHVHSPESEKLPPRGCGATVPSSVSSGDLRHACTCTRPDLRAAGSGI